MGTWVDGWYVPTHFSQFDPNDPRASSACVVAAVRNGADAVTSGRTSKTVYAVHRLVPRWQESSPATAGWSLADAHLAASRMDLSFIDHSGTGRTGVRDALADHKYLIVQGDSDRFGNSTCSGRFDGSHAIGWHPMSRVRNGVREWWINDGICPVGRWERESVLWAYAEKLNARIRFGSFTRPVAHIPDTSTATHRVVLAPHAEIRLYYLAKPSSGNIYCISDWDRPDKIWGSRRSSAPCAAPVNRKTCDGKSGATTALITAGVYAGRHMRISPSDGVSIVTV